MNAQDIVSGRYRIERHIGRGGMQDVYLAQDILLESNVALKTPQPGQPDKRFKSSAKISARVNHHNVAKTLDYIEENGRLFLLKSSLMVTILKISSRPLELSTRTSLLVYFCTFPKALPLHIMLELFIVT